MIKTGGMILLRRCLNTRLMDVPKICIVGSGPAGFYAAQHIAKKLDKCQIDILEKLPVPFGLVRFGVAPDHPDVKNVIHTFTKTPKMPNVKFFGNITLGKDITLEDLKTAYHIVLLTYGAEKNRNLNIPGEDLKNVISARNIVGWYNGLPSARDLEIDLNAESVSIIGQGNVAIDVARILLTPPDELKTTDITQYSLERLSTSKVKKVYLIGRRGPLQAAYTIKELREMLKLKNCSTIWRKEDFQGIETTDVEKMPRPRKRITELMLKSVAEQQEIDNINTKVFNPVFLRSPLEILGNDVAEKVVLGLNKLEGDDDIIKKAAVLTDKTETICSSLVVTSIGYKSVQADANIPFDNKKGVILNDRGKISPGLYTAGWLGTGPVGVILTTMSNAFGVADQIINDINKGDILTTSKPGFPAVKQILDQQNVQVVEWSDWEKIDKYEIDQGKKVGKPREKIVDIKQMLEIANS